MSTAPVTRAQIPEKLAFLFQPTRAKVIYGGRDGVKSWSVAQALLILGAQRPIRILCARETQQAIRESVHQLLADTAKRLGLELFYDVLQYTIRGKNGTEIIFSGLRNLTSAQLKSYESIDIVWVEEASAVTKRSWQVLIPTIRKPGSEIWVTFNPDLATDDTYLRWVVSPPPGTVSVMTSYRDNAWLSKESAHEIEYLRVNDPETFKHVYEGATRCTIAGAVYRAEIMAAEAGGRITQVPYDRSLPVRTFWDLGWSDLVCIWFAQAEAFRYRIIDYYEDNFQSSDHYLQVLQQRGYTYSQAPAAIVWPWDASTKMNRESTEASIRAKGFSLRILDQASKNGGIDAVRRMFPQMYFDAEKCSEGLAKLRRYQWGPATDGDRLKREPLHDINCLHPDTLVLTRSGACPIMELKGQEVLTPCGWSTYQGPWITKRDAPLVEVRFSDGFTVKCTPEHLFSTENGWKSAESLTKGSTIHSTLTLSRSFSMAAYSSAGRVKSTGLGLAKRCIERYGRALSGLSLPGATSTIATAMHPITSFQTWNAYPQKNTCLPPGRPSTEEGRYRQQPERAPQLGIGLKLADYGISDRREMKSHGSSRNERSETASSAAKKCWLWCATSIRNAFARLPASRRVVEEVRWLQETSDVCCIHVPDAHCFSLSNGAVVHNSHPADALRTLAVDIRAPFVPPKQKSRPMEYSQWG